MRTLKDELTKIVGETEMKEEQTKVKHNNPRLTLAQVKKVRALYKQGNKYTAIAAHMGITYGQVQRAIRSAKRVVTKPYKKKTSPQTRELLEPKQETNFDNSETWKQKYLKAVSKLVEHGLIEVNF